MQSEARGMGKERGRDVDKLALSYSQMTVRTSARHFFPLRRLSTPIMH